MLKLAFSLAVFCALCSSRLVISGFTLSAVKMPPSTALYLQTKEGTSKETSRRAFVGVVAVATLSVVPTAARADTGAEVRGTPVNAFNGLAFQYRGSDFDGLKASELSEPSVSYAEFVEKLKAGEVAFVEFMAPDGDAAYATFKDGPSGTKPAIRIGEGYPIEQHDGYSSPAFAIRTVKNAGVPYKFVVPALRKYSGSS
jgi:hypothetical protein